MPCYASAMVIQGDLSITCGQSNTDNAKATFDVSECFQNFGFPGSMRGRFLNLALNRLLWFASDRSVRVGFRGGRYRFADVGADGSFTLQRYSEA
jgi:hypothetical protein